MILKCQECDKTQPVPMHCGEEMHLEEIEAKEMLVCWMGAGCGKQDIPEHCGKPMMVTDNPGNRSDSEGKNALDATVGGNVLLECKTCNSTQGIPVHCKKPMHIEVIDGKKHFVCWMGAGCGKQDIPEHCGEPMELIDKQTAIKEERIEEESIKEEVHPGLVPPVLTKTTKATLAVTGMTCASCVSHVEKGLKKDGVISTSINLVTEKVMVEYDPEQVSVKDLVKFVEGTGYGAKELETRETGVPGEVTFSIGGMTCANCVSTIEKALTNTAGVTEASVNLTTERATVKFNPDKVTVDNLVKAVEKSGYRAVVYDSQSGIDQEKILREKELRTQKFRLVLSVIFALPTVILAMTNDFFPQLLADLLPFLMQEIEVIPPLHAILPLEIVMLILATPVQFISGWGFYTGSYRSLKARSANMDVLIALGTSAAYFYSLTTTFFIIGPVFYET
ncbi:MAG: copper ion binding protein, partial [Candidatus Hodarchaeales archaeon]